VNNNNAKNSKLTNDCRYAKLKQCDQNTFNKKKTLFTSKLDLYLRNKLVKCYIWSMAFYGAGGWMLRVADQKYLESFEMWRWRRMEIS